VRGLSETEIEKTIVGLRALGEIMGVAPPQLDQILVRAKKDMEDFVPPTPTPPTTP